MARYMSGCYVKWPTREELPDPNYIERATALLAEMTTLFKKYNARFMSDFGESLLIDDTFVMDGVGQDNEAAAFWGTLCKRFIPLSEEEGRPIFNRQIAEARAEVKRQIAAGVSVWEFAAIDRDGRHISLDVEETSVPT